MRVYVLFIEKEKKKEKESYLASWWHVSGCMCDIRHVITHFQVWKCWWNISIEITTGSV
jgi:hypothetical protein